MVSDTEKQPKPKLKKRRRIVISETDSSDECDSPTVKTRRRQRITRIKNEIKMLSKGKNCELQAAGSSQNVECEKNSEPCNGKILDADAELARSRLNSNTLETGKTSNKVADGASSSKSDLNVENNDNATPDQCPICWTPFTNQEIGTPTCCEHIYCLQCLIEWSKNENSCPIDRRIFTMIEVRERQGGIVTRYMPAEIRNNATEDENNQSEPNSLHYSDLFQSTDEETNPWSEQSNILDRSVFSSRMRSTTPEMDLSSNDNHQVRDSSSSTDMENLWPSPIVTNHSDDRETTFGWSSDGEINFSSNQENERNSSSNQENEINSSSSPEYERNYSSNPEDERNYSSNQEDERNYSSNQEDERNYSSDQEDERNYSSNQENERNYSSNQEDERNYSSNQEDERNYSSNQDGGASNSSSDQNNGGSNRSCNQDDGASNSSNNYNGNSASSPTVDYSTPDRNDSSTSYEINSSPVVRNSTSSSSISATSNRSYSTSLTNSYSSPLHDYSRSPSFLSSPSSSSDTSYSS